MAFSQNKKMFGLSRWCHMSIFLRLSLQGDSCCYERAEQAQYKLITDGMSTLTSYDALRKKCTDIPGYDLVSITDAAEVQSLYDWLVAQGHDMQQGRGVPIAVTHQQVNEYSDLTDRSRGVDSILTEAYNTGEWDTDDWKSHTGTSELAGFGWGSGGTKQDGIHDWPYSDYPSGVVCEKAAPYAG